MCFTVYFLFWHTRSQITKIGLHESPLTSSTISVLSDLSLTLKTELANQIKKTTFSKAHNIE